MAMYQIYFTYLIALIIKKVNKKKFFLRNSFVLYLFASDLCVTLNVKLFI